jgi:ribonuclease E
MITTITPLRRLAVTLVLTGATVFGAVAIAPAAFADETSTVTEDASVTETAPEVVVPEVVVPATPPVVEPAPVVESTPAPAPVVTPPPAVVIGKDGKPVAAPKVCTTKDMAERAAKIAKATAQAAPLLRTATKLREASALLRAQPVKNPSQARIALALADAADLAAAKLEAQAADLIAKAGQLSCLVLTAPGTRF